MKAIITVEVPEHQIGQEVSVYFKDTMCVKGTCESETEVYAKHDEEIIKETVESIWGKPPYTEVLDKIASEIEEQVKLVESMGCSAKQFRVAWGIVNQYREVRKNEPDN